MKIKLKNILFNNDGSIWIISNFVFILILGFCAVVASLAVQDALASRHQRLLTVAMSIAEAGLNRAIYDLRQDYLNDSTPAWDDGDINGMAVGPDTANFYTLSYGSTALNGGSYTAQIKNVAGKSHAWIQSIGTFNGKSYTLRAYARISKISIWDTAIFGGAGGSGTMINGNVDIRGSVHILGNGLNPGDYALDLGGTAQLVGNNYSGLSASLSAKVPALPTTTFNGEIVSTLNAELRIKNGIIGLSGSATAGENNVAGNSVKETVDGVYVTDGFGGSSGVSAVYSDNGTSQAYDLGNDISFPSLSDPSKNNPSQTNQEYFAANALVLTTELSNIKPNSSFAYQQLDGGGNVVGKITMDGSGHLYVEGHVYVDGGNDVSFSKNGGNKYIEYTGTGTILATGNVSINTSLVTTGNNSFPNNVIGFMTPNNLSINESQIDIMGAFYAENEISVAKQTDIMGTIVANQVNMGTNVPSIYQVPELVNNLPPGMIGNDGVTIMTIEDWQWQ